MEVKVRQMSELQKQTEYLQSSVPEKIEDIVKKKGEVETRFEKLKEPLYHRQRQLEKNKEAFQV